MRLEKQQKHYKNARLKNNKNFLTSEEIPLIILFGVRISHQTPKRCKAPNAQVAQLVEQRTENPRVGGSIPSLGIFYINDKPREIRGFLFFTGQ